MIHDQEQSCGLPTPPRRLRRRPFHGSLIDGAFVFSIPHIIVGLILLICAIEDTFSSATGPDVTLWLIALIWNGVAGRAVWFGLIRPIIYRSLVVNGEVCCGIVIEKNIKRSWRGKPRSLEIRYQFDPTRMYSCRASGPINGSVIVVNNADWDDAYEGQPVTVLFDRRNPRWNICYNFANYEVDQSQHLGDGSGNRLL